METNDADKKLTFVEQLCCILWKDKSERTEEEILSKINSIRSRYTELSLISSNASDIVRECKIAIDQSNVGYAHLSLETRIRILTEERDSARARCRIFEDQIRVKLNKLKD